MTTYTPDRWDIVKIEQPGKKVLFKLFGEWSGGYLDGKAWRMNSGIVSVEEDKHALRVHGHSGSSYVVTKQMRGLGAYGMGILQGLIEQINDKYPDAKIGIYDGDAKKMSGVTHSKMKD